MIIIIYSLFIIILTIYDFFITYISLSFYIIA